MDHYQDIRVLPDPEFTASVLMNAMFAKLHRALVDAGRGEIGVSFPTAGKTLGDCLRLHGAAEALHRLADQNWLKGLRDYTDSSEIRPVPANARHRVVRRFQVANSMERKRRRSIKNGKCSEAEAIAAIPDVPVEKSTLPFVVLTSHSNGHRFHLLIEQMLVQTHAVTGKFSDYGLSQLATVPYF